MPLADTVKCIPASPAGHDVVEPLLIFERTIHVSPHLIVREGCGLGWAA
jgi:hypothetical protein